MNVTIHQVKKNIEETKTAVKKARERRQSTGFRKAVCCPSAIVHGEARRKNSSTGVPGVDEILGNANSHFDPTQTGSGTASPC